MIDVRWMLVSPQFSWGYFPVSLFNTNSLYLARDSLLRHLCARICFLIAVF